MCRVSAFCCGCSLRSAAITAAVLNALFLLGMLISTTYIFVLANEVESDDIPKGGILSMAGVNVKDGRLIRQDEWDESKEHRESVAFYIRIVAGSLLFVALIAFTILLCLCMGIAKNKADCVMPWLIGYMIKIVIVGLGVVSGAITLQLIPTIIGAVQLAFDIYLWIVVLNYYRELRGSSGYQPTMVYKA